MRRLLYGLTLILLYLAFVVFAHQKLHSLDKPIAVEQKEEKTMLDQMAEGTWEYSTDSRFGPL